MRTALLIGWNDVRMFLREKSSIVWLAVIPLVMTFFLGFATRAPGKPSNPWVTVLIENRDAGFLSRVFLDLLGTQGLNLVGPTNRDEARRGLRIPDDFTARVLERKPSKLEFFTVGDGGQDAAALVELRVVRALIDINALLVDHATAHPGVELTEASLRELRKREDAATLKSSFAGRKPSPVGFGLSVPGNLVAYLMMNLLIFGGTRLAWERRSGVLRRQLVHPVSPGEVVAGKILGLVFLAMLQSAVLLLAGRFCFGVELGDRLPALLLTLLVLGWVAASLGVLLGSIVRAEDKTVGLGVFLSLVMAAIGGCWWPLEVVPDSVKLLAHLVPTGWAMDALHQLITFGGGLAQAWDEIGVLALYGLAANWAAAKCFRY